MRPSRSRRSRRTHRNRRGGAGEPKPLLTFTAAQPNPNLPMNPLNPPLNPVNPPLNPVNPPFHPPPNFFLNPPPAPQLQKTHKAFPHPVKLGGKRRHRSRRYRR